MKIKGAPPNNKGIMSNMIIKKKKHRKVRWKKDCMSREGGNQIKKLSTGEEIAKGKIKRGIQGGGEWWGWGTAGF